MNPVDIGGLAIAGVYLLRVIYIYYGRKSS